MIINSFVHPILQLFRKRNHYDVLDIPYDATDEEIKNAFIKKSQEVSLKFSFLILQAMTGMIVVKDVDHFSHQLQEDIKIVKISVIY